MEDGKPGKLYAHLSALDNEHPVAHFALSDDNFAIVAAAMLQKIRELTEEAAN